MVFAAGLTMFSRRKIWDTWSKTMEQSCYIQAVLLIIGSHSASFRCMSPPLLNGEAKGFHVLSLWSPAPIIRVWGIVDAKQMIIEQRVCGAPGDEFSLLIPSSQMEIKSCLSKPVMVSRLFGAVGSESHFEVTPFEPQIKCNIYIWEGSARNKTFERIQFHKIGYRFFPSMVLLFSHHL